MRDHGCKTGLVFNPATPLDVLRHVADKIDMVLLMAVNPGFGGQTFIPHTLDKLSEARNRLDELGSEARLEIDGGINAGNIGQAGAAGADTFVAGSAIFGAPDYAGAVAQMRASIGPSF